MGYFFESELDNYDVVTVEFDGVPADSGSGSYGWDFEYIEVTDADGFLVETTDAEEKRFMEEATDYVEAKYDPYG
jgi:hypothetical protein